jgi:hypothetical protein
MENTLKNKLTKTTTNKKIDNASIKAIIALNKLMKALDNANSELCKKDATKEQERFDIEEYSANSICIDKLLQARGIVLQISSNCLNA